MAEQRTEQPTPRRLERARREGQFPQSKEFIAAIQFVGFLALLFLFTGGWFFDLIKLARITLVRAFTLELTPTNFVLLVRDQVWKVFAPLVLGGAALMAVVLLAQMVVTRFGLAGSKLAPELKRLDFLSRLKGLPSQNLPILFQAMILLPAVAWAVYFEAGENFGDFITLPWLNPQAGLLRVVASFKTLLWRVAALFVVIGLLDLWRQKRRFTNQLKMTKHEVRQESREQQGNPHIKARIRRLQRDAARRQMIKQVPKATAVIVNPTHFAVAIRYSMTAGGAPRVVAKGKNYLAHRIRTIAIEHQIPIVENPPLAQALYKSAEVGQEIPADLYRAVAEILAYIYRLMGGRLPG